MSNKLALLVGVDTYAHFPAHQLVCCKNDARLMARVLRERFGFVEEGITLLLDEAATYENVVAGLRNLREKVRKGDSVVFYYSGHGTRFTDTTGDKPGGWSEALVPHDGGHPSHVSLLTDDEIYEWILAVSDVTPDLTLVADTCFSGGAVRESPRLGEKWIVVRGPTGRPKAKAGARRFRDVGPIGFLPASERYVLLAACLAGETAKEMRELQTPRSAFTLFLCQELSQAVKNATYRDVHERTRLAVRAAVQNQNPQLEGARDRLLFGGGGTAPEPYLLVDSVFEAPDGRRARLSGGVLRGVGAGWQGAVYPQGTRNPRGAKRLGVVEVARTADVHAVSAEARILREKGAIEPGDRVFETSKGARCGVAIETAEIDPRSRTALARRIERSPALRLVEDATEAEARIRVDGAHWIALDRGGELVLPPIPLSAPGAVARLAADLETRARFLEILCLAAEIEGNPLHGCLEAQLLRRLEDGKGRPARPDRRTGEIVYREGEALALRIRNRADRPLFIHVLDLGLTGAVAPLYPVPGKHVPLVPGRALDIGLSPDPKLRVQKLPELFAHGSKARGEEEPRGREVLKIIATTNAADLSDLRQPGYGAGHEGRKPSRGEASPLNRLLGRRMRDGGPSASREGEELWTAVACEFLVRAGEKKR